MSNIIGHFTLKMNNDGRSITGRYSNRNLNVIFNHQATLEGKKEHEFIGKYNAKWDDIGGKDESELTIEFKEGTNDIYVLNWTGGGTNYSGEGFIEDGILIGNYVSI